MENASKLVVEKQLGHEKVFWWKGGLSSPTGACISTAQGINVTARCFTLTLTQVLPHVISGWDLILSKTTNQNPSNSLQLRQSSENCENTGYEWITDHKAASFLYQCLYSSETNTWKSSFPFNSYCLYCILVIWNTKLHNFALILHKKINMWGKI